MERTKRIEWVDIVKYVCIIMVMLSHLETRTDIWRAFYTPFFLSAFFFSAGYVYKPKSSFKDFLYKKFRQLFIPWLVFSVFDIVLSQIITFNEHDGLLEELKWNFLQIRGQGDQIWFVAALFVAFMPFYFFIKRYEAISEKISGGVQQEMHTCNCSGMDSLVRQYIIHWICSGNCVAMEQHSIAMAY